MEFPSVLLSALAVLIILIVPVMLAARLVQARNQGVIAAGLALLVAAAVDFVVGTLFAAGAVSFVLQLGIVAFAFSQILGTDYFRGLAVSLLWGVFSIGITTLLGLLGVGRAVLRA